VAEIIGTDNTYTHKDIMLFNYLELGFKSVTTLNYTITVTVCGGSEIRIMGKDGLIIKERSLLNHYNTKRVIPVMALRCIFA